MPAPMSQRRNLPVPYVSAARRSGLSPNRALSARSWSSLQQLHQRFWPEWPKLHKILSLIDHRRRQPTNLRQHDLLYLMEPFNGERGCLLYTSDAADDLTRVDLGGRRIINKKKSKT